MKDPKEEAMSWLARCSGCGRGMLFGLHPVSHTWFQLMWEQRSARYACKTCGAHFDVNIRKARWLGTLYGVLCIPAILILAFSFDEFSVPDSLAFAIFLAPVAICLVAQAGIRCIISLEYDKEPDNNTQEGTATPRRPSE